VLVNNRERSIIAVFCLVLSATTAANTKKLPRTELQKMVINEQAEAAAHHHRLRQ